MCEKERKTYPGCGSHSRAGSDHTSKQHRNHIENTSEVGEEGVVASNGEFVQGDEGGGDGAGNGAGDPAAGADDGDPADHPARGAQRRALLLGGGEGVAQPILCVQCARIRGVHAQ